MIHAGVWGRGADLRVLEPGTLPALLKSCPVGAQSIKSHSNQLDHPVMVFALLANSNGVISMNKELCQGLWEMERLNTRAFP